MRARVLCRTGPDVLVETQCTTQQPLAYCLVVRSEGTAELLRRPFRGSRFCLPTPRQNVSHDYIAAEDGGKYCLELNGNEHSWTEQQLSPCVSTTCALFTQVSVSPLTSIDLSLT